MAGKARPRAARKTALRVNTPLFFLTAALLLLFGGYYDAMVFPAGALLGVLLPLELRRRGTLPLPPLIWPLAGLALCAAVTLPFAVSPGMALTGVLRWLVALLFCLYAACYTAGERALALDGLAALGAGMAGVSTVFFLLSGGSDANGRMDGFFQYANSYALFLLVCLALLAGKEKRSRWDWPAMAVLLLGVALTGSRGALLLLGAGVLVWSLWQLLRRRRALPVVLALAALVGLGTLAAALSGGLLLDRLGAITLESSSLNGRLLYYLDGLRLLGERPMGVGRGGYLYVQPLIQTGPYILKSIHNEYLQAALDGGPAAGVLLAVLAGLCVFRRGLPLRQRGAAALLALHAAIDFDFQFFALLLVLLLCGLGEEKRAVPLPRRGALAGAGVLTAALAWFSLPYGLAFWGQSGPAWTLWPADLSLAEARLQSCAELEEAGAVADAILTDTSLSMLAWDCKYAQAAVEVDYPSMTSYRYNYLLLNPYRSEVYEGMATLLETACRQDSEHTDIYQTLAEATRRRLEEVMDRTSLLAWRIADRPDFSFAPAVLQRLNDLEEMRE
ncbi:O-antigen ligase family protein [uncultured Flavonifractor sp.]|uniref:O-antigen ligase family protein n=1 Tax=uncultured Flavonifractor sp. TaxID=1193534 RepID=UPI002605A927|nr:O-antigen ligase family protein [uncultured Flavonifractor sp.]